MTFRQIYSKLLIIFTVLLLLVVFKEVPNEINGFERIQTANMMINRLEVNTNQIDGYTCDEPFLINYSTYPSYVLTRSVNWESSNEEVASVENGFVTFKGEGECDITLTVDGLKEVIHVNSTYSPYFAPALPKEDIPGLTYIDDILIVNKTYSLPQSYNPGGILKEVLKAFNDMAEDAKKDDVDLYILSGFRSYETQNRLFERYAATDGYKEAETYSARPGHSEHQTGQAMDVNVIDYNFYYTKEGKWLADNCKYYGFIIRYDKGKTPSTGYIWEPWHIRFLGTEKAIKITNSGLSLEEYYGITSTYKK